MSTDTSLTEKKRLGAFYTPQELSDLLVSWAITNRTDAVLEPSFGGCGFLKSCADRYKELGNNDKNLPLYGCDIDQNAFNYLSNTIGNLVDLSNFILEDFLTLQKPKTWPKNFNAVIGNPPYIPYQNISLSSREHAVKKIRALGLNIDLRASLWAYFILLGLEHLAPKGKIAWVIPGSFLQANYAKPIREYLNSKFEDIAAFQIKERLFLYEGTDETTVVLLGSGYNNKKASKKNNIDIPLGYCNSYEELGDSIAKWQTERVTSSSCASPITGFLSKETQNAYQKLLALTQCKKVGDYASIRIGLVTGANKFFIIDKQTASLNKLRLSCLMPILGKFSCVSGLNFSKANHQKNLEDNIRCLLVSSNKKKPTSKYLLKYLESFPQDKIDSTSTFKGKKLWHSIQDNKIPDAFFPVMHHTGPRIVLNTARINCTNSIHRVYFQKNTKADLKKLISISILSSFSQLSAEIEGRKYGSGVLKHEPRESEKINILIPSNINSKKIISEYQKINRLLKKGSLDEARQKADKFILSALKIDNTENIIKNLSSGLSKARKQRYTDRRK